jgi:uncharacterized protein involved in exopolysaccharide biosynthesis
MDISSEKNISEELPAKGFQTVLESIRPIVVKLWIIKKKLAKIIAIEFFISVSLVYFFAKPYFESTVTILPDYGNNSMLGSLSQLASIAGVSVGEVSPTEIYEKLIYSEAIIESVVREKYLTKEFKDSVTLIEYFEYEGDNDLSFSQQDRQKFLKCYESMTKSRIKTEISALTKILDVRVKMPESQLSADVVNKLVEYLDRYVRTKRRSYASNQRFYLEKRMEQVKDSLGYFEEKLRNFQERNKIVLQSPELLLQQTRLLREVNVLQAVYSQITQQLELVKIDEIRDAPVINIKEFARDPIKKAGPSRILYSLVLFLVLMTITIYYYAHQNEINQFRKDISIFFRNLHYREQ